MKKRILVLTSLLLLVSCNKGTDFDNDFNSIKDNLLHGSDFITLNKKEDSLYDYEFNNLDLGVKIYFQELSSDYSFALVLILSYSNTRIEDIRSLVCVINDNKSTFAQIGFDGNKKIIDYYNDSSLSTYKGIQTFVTPFNSETSIARFYFESSSFNGSYFEINNVEGIK